MHPAFAGADRVVEKLIENYPAGHEFHVYVLRGAGRAESARPNVHLIRVPALRGKHLGPFSYFLLCSLHCVFRRRIRLAHVHNSDFGLFCALLRLRPGLKIIGTFHGDPYERGKWGRFARWYLRLSEAVFLRCCHCLTTVARSKLDACAPAFRQKLEHVPNGVDSYWDAAVSRPFDSVRHGLVPGGYILFACGRLDPTKGLHHLLEACERAACREKLLIVGDFSHHPAYSSQILDACAGKDNIVVLRELLPREVLIDAIRNCKLAVLPSEVEGMSMMLLEIISCRRPVICSDIRENLEVVGEGYPYLFRSRQPADLARMLVEALSDARRDEVAQALFASCMDRFSWPSVARRYLDLYESVLTGR